MTTPKGNRLHIGFFGRRNAGKSTLLNALTRQEVSIVSETPGTTTDPVEKNMEILPLGACRLIDTAGIDDTGALGEQRIAKTRKIFDRTDLAVLVSDGTWNEFEEKLLAEFQNRKIAVVIVFNKTDINRVDKTLIDRLKKERIPVIQTSATHGQGLAELRAALLRSVPKEFLNEPPILADLVPPGKFAVLVVPIDKEAPKGRLILPQVQAIRDLLDGDAGCIVVKERELRYALDQLKEPPALVVTDSQAFLKVSADTPDNIPLTSFSILLARHKGDLNEFVRGAKAIDALQPGDRVLIAESCTHHPIADDIGRVKIPRWLRQYVGGDLTCDVHAGHDFPKNLGDYHLVIHCGGCMTNRREILSRIAYCKEHDVPITNYGLAIAKTLGILERALRPFPAALEIYGNA